MLKLLWPISILLIVAFGVAEGLWTDRWSLFQGPEQASAMLAMIPMKVGDWEGQDQEMESRQLAAAEVTGYIARVYTHRGTSKRVQVLLICGRPGPTCVHTPEVCYVGAGYGAAEDKVTQVLKDGLPTPAAFWVCKYQKNGPLPEGLRIYWAWNATGPWVAPANPRWDLASYRFLYKLYAVHPMDATDESAAQDPTPEFLRVFLPEVQKKLMTNTESPAGRSS